MKHLLKSLPKDDLVEYWMRRVYTKFLWLKRYMSIRNRKRLVEKVARKALRLRGKPNGNVVLVVVDALRYRNMSFIRYYRETTPFLDKFGLKFKAYAPAPHTYSSVPSILTGLYPHNHGAFIGGLVKDMYLIGNYYPPKANIVTLPEVLRVLYGYDVIFLSTIFPSLLPLKNTIIPLRDLGKITANKVLNKAFRMIYKAVRKNRRFFAYIHLGDLHEPLTPPLEYRNYFGEVKNLPRTSYF